MSVADNATGEAKASPALSEMTSARLATDAPSEKAKLVASLQALTGELTLQIQQGRQSFERLPLDDFLSSSHQDGLISVYPVQSYIRCWRLAFHARQAIE